MDPVGATCILLGGLIILTRAPLIFAPKPTLDLYHGLLATPKRIRLLGVGYVLFGGWIAFAGLGEPGIVGEALLWLGAGVVGVGMAMALLPGRAGRMVRSIIDTLEAAVDPAIIRLIGVLAVALGAALIWLGVTR